MTVAIITRTKNRPITLKRAIESVLSQTYESWTHVIVNDGGETAPVDELVRQYESQYKGRVKVIHNPQSLGMEAASNVGLKSCDSKYVLIHDDDDSLESEFLTTAVEGLQNKPVDSIKGVVTHTKQVFETVTENSIDYSHSHSFDPHLSAISLPKICEINKFMPISFLYEREVFDLIGYYDETLPVCGDWEFNIRFLSKFDILVLKEELANYHIRLNDNKNYNNTVTHGVDKHELYRSLIINRHIRHDIEEGNMSIASLLSVGENTHGIAQNTWVVTRIVSKLTNMKLLSPLKKVFK